MRILFLTHDFPYPVTYGGALYTGNVIKELALLADEMNVVCFKKNSSVENIEVDGAKYTCFPKPRVSVLKRIFSRFPNVVEKYRSAEFKTYVEKTLKEDQWDVVIIDYIAIGWTVDCILKTVESLSERPLVLYMSHNVETHLRRDIAKKYKGNWFIRKMARIDSERACRLESTLALKTDVTTVETEEDAQAFHKLFPGISTMLVTPGYDGKYIAERTISESVAPGIAVLGGRLSTMKQLVLDALLEETSEGIARHGLQMHVIGPTTEAYLSKCRRLYPQIQFHGFVDDLTPLLGQIRLGVVADHVGGGFKHRILTYVFYRIPIIGMPEALAGLPLTAGEDYIPISSYAEIPDVCMRYLNQHEALNKLQMNAYDKCVKEFSWERSIQNFKSELTRECHVAKTAT